MTPIFIASKGRAGKSELLSQLNTVTDRYSITVFVEPQDMELYSLYYPNLYLYNIGHNNKGLPFVRNFMLQYAYNNDLIWYWNLDDDVKLFEVEDGKCKHAYIDILQKAEQYFINDLSIGQVGLEYQQFAWSSKNEYSYNSYCDCVVCINVDLCHKLVFDENSVLKLDRDFTMQVIKSGYRTMKISKYAFGSPKNGSNVGGLYDVYKTNMEEINCIYMEQKWGKEICKHIIKNDGRHDIKIEWSKINKQEKIVPKQTNSNPLFNFE